jgi:hypothetical protein
MLREMRLGMLECSGRWRRGEGLLRELGGWRVSVQFRGWQDGTRSNLRLDCAAAGLRVTAMCSGRKLTIWKD